MADTDDKQQNGVVVDLNSSETAEMRRLVYKLLADAYPENAGEVMELFIEQCIVAGEEHFAALVFDAATLAVVDTLSRKRRKPWLTFCSHMLAIVRNQVEKIRLDRETDPPRHHYTRLVGPKPHGMPGYEEVRLWNDGLLEWRQRGGRYFVTRRREGWPNMFLRAVELARQSPEFAEAVDFNNWEANQKGIDNT